MKNYFIRRYTLEDYAIWNNFVSSAKNATFLFHRDFMEYHSDRFQDFSLLVFDEDKLISVLPANRVGETIFSHQGLTYGGFVFLDEMDKNEVEVIVKKIVEYLDKKDFKFLVIKEMISIYEKRIIIRFNDFFSNEEVTILDEKIYLAINYRSDYKISKSKLKHYRRLQSEGLIIKKESNFEVFWKTILEPLLDEKYNTKPVHSLEEIELLGNKFPENIEQYSLYKEDEILAGITIFKTQNVVKSQYGATTEKGKMYRALDYLFIYLVEMFANGFDFFDMGTVNDNSELGYNLGLYNQKKELGCDVFTQSIYQIRI